MNKLFILSLAILFSMTSCVVEKDVLPDGDLPISAVLDINNSPLFVEEADKCALEMRLILDESSPCGYYLESPLLDFTLVAKNSDEIVGKFKPGVKLVVGMDVQSIKENYCGDSYGADMTCVRYSLEVPPTAEDIENIEDFNRIK